MTDIIVKACNKAKKAMDEILERSEKYINVRGKADLRRYWKEKYLREFWNYSFSMANEAMKGEPADMDDIIEHLEILSCGECKVTRTSTFADMRLRNYTYLISKSQTETFITAFNAFSQKTLLSSEDTARLIMAIDIHLNKWEESIDEAFLAFCAEKQACEMMKTTALALIGDIFDEKGKIDFKMKLQKNGRIRCTLIGPNYWDQKKLFRTTWETFREDFIKAYMEFKKRLNSRFCTL